jgi:predicted dithiol-disulfide oxidoreductase (DUF899 family)
LSQSELRFPGETDEYRRARKALLEAELDLRRQIERVAEQRRALPPGGDVTTDYGFDEWDGAAGKVRQTRLSELFAAGKDSLFLYSFMFRPGEAGLPLEVPCPICTSIIDGLDGAVRHLDQRINFAVIAKVPVERLAAHARSRGWQHVRLLSAANTTYNRDYLAESEGEEQFAMAAVFRRTDGPVTSGAASSGTSRRNPARILATSTSSGRCGRSSTIRQRAAAATGCRACAIRQVADEAPRRRSRPFPPSARRRARPA